MKFLCGFKICQHESKLLIKTAFKQLVNN